MNKKSLNKSWRNQHSIKSERFEVVYWKLCKYFFILQKARNPEKCIESAATITVVEFCPRTPKEFVNRISEKGCFNLEHNCRSFEYHCVINEWMTEIIEVCAPSKIIVGKTTLLQN